MSLAWFWVLPIVLLPMLGVALWQLRRPAKRDIRFVSSVDTLSGLPSFKKELRRARRLHFLEIACIAVLVVTLALVAARPQEQIRKVENTKSRDIVLCVDISGSMVNYIPAAFTALQKVVKDNPTDRYALVLFRDSPYVAIPLTSDVVAIDTVSKDFAAQFASPEFNAAKSIGFSPTVGGGTDIGAGLASCFRRFDVIQQPRSRHIIFISDMENNGQTDQSAIATLLPKYGVKLYILAPSEALSIAEQSPVTQITSASVHALTDQNSETAALDEIYKSILNNRETSSYVLADSPYVLWGVAVLAVTAWAFVLMLRWRRK